MSYILDALQRAEAERERSGVPGLHTRTGLPGASPKVLSSRHRATLAAAVVFALGVVAAGLWVWRAPTSIQGAMPVAVPDANPAPMAQPAPVPAVPLTATSVASEPVARVVIPKAAPALPDTTPVAKPATPVTPLVSAAIAAKASAQAATNTLLLSELPPDIRSQIPALAITGAVYSDNPAQRLLLINGQVLSQGSLAAPDLTLERIGANTSEFSFRGTRFRMAH
jgi:general secretion pathway protein B